MTTSNNNQLDVERTPRVKTKLKFQRSERSDSLVSYVSFNPVTGMVRGVRQDSKYKKMVCVVDRGIASTLLLNTLYDCTMVPMVDKLGYVVISAIPAKFKATVNSMYVKNNIYLVEVKFGNKTLRFDPYNGRKPTVNDLSAFRDMLLKRVDIYNLEKVVEDFDMQAQIILDHMKADRFMDTRDIR